MERYYQADERIQKRSNKNKSLYDSLYEGAEYSNVEGISIIEKNESVDIEKIKELLNYDKKKEEQKPQTPARVYEEPKIVEEKNYDLKDFLAQAKQDRPEKKELANTQYNILKNIDLTKNYNEKATEEELKKMIESITSNNQTGDLFDDLKTIHSPNLKEEVEEEMDKSLFTSSLGFTSKDFEDLNDIKHEVKKNGILVKILLFVFLVIIVTSCIFLGYSFFNK